MLLPVLTTPPTHIAFIIYHISRITYHFNRYDIESARTQAELGVFCSILPPALQALFATVDVQGKGLSDKEKESVIEQSASEVVKLIANRNTAIADHAAEVEKCFA